MVWFGAIKKEIKMSTKLRTHSFPVVIEKDEDGMLIASVTSIPHCHTQAKNMDTLLKRIKEAIELCLEVEKDIAPYKFVGLAEVEVLAK